MTSTRSERILALDVHPLNFGFVVLEGPDQLIDWGVRSFRRGVNAVKVPMRKKLDLLFNEYQPSVLIVGKAGTRVSRQVMIAKLATAHHIRVRTISRDSIRKALPQSNRNKHDIAKAIAGCCPDLAPYLPAKRKPWQSEKYAMGVFVAAALGLTYLAQRVAQNRNAKLSPFAGPSVA